MLQLELTLSSAVSTITDGPKAEMGLKEVAHLLHPFHPHACLEQEDEDKEGDTDSDHCDRKPPVTGAYGKLRNTKDGLL